MNKSDETKKRILKAAMQLFARYGYTTTSTRMIAAAAEANIASISLYYGGKQQLFEACLQKCYEYIEKYYRKTYDKVNVAVKEGSLDADKAYGFLLEMIDMQLEVAFDDRYQTTRELIYSENNDMEDGDKNYLSAQIFDINEKLMAMLISRVAPVGEKESIVVSRYINGAVISFGEHGSLYKRYVSLGEKENAPEWVRQQVRNCCLYVIDGLREQKA